MSLNSAQAWKASRLRAQQCGSQHPRLPQTKTRTTGAGAGISAYVGVDRGSTGGLQGVNTQQGDRSAGRQRRVSSMAAEPQVPAAHRGACTAPTRP
eukprot:1195501-Prorocentrum_minimum.AAC.4